MRLDSFKPLLAVLLGIVLATASSVAAAQPLELTAATPESLEKRLRTTGWSVVGQPIATDVPELRSWIWAIAQGESGGAVGLYVYRDVKPAENLVEILKGNRDAAVTRQSNVVLSVIMTGRPDAARELLGRLTTTSPDRAAGTAAPSPRSPLPELRFGPLHRAEVLNVALLQGWQLVAAPQVSDTAAYQAVTWQLRSPEHPIFLTLYACRDATCVRDVEAATRKSPHATAVRRGRSVLVVLTPTPVPATRTFLTQLNERAR